jgi:hypothetical protein
MLQVTISSLAEQVQLLALSLSFRRRCPEFPRGMAAQFVFWPFSAGLVPSTVRPASSDEKGVPAVTLFLPGFASHPSRTSGRTGQLLGWRLEVLMGLAIWVFASSASAQATPGPSRIQDRKDKQAIPAVVAPVEQPPHPVVPVYGADALEQTLPQPPEVVWDGKQLTIDAENSRLSDILSAVRLKTGASVDFPDGAASERVVVHLGPAAVREVLSSLLYGTDFDYVIQSADDDEDGLRSLVVTLHGKGGDEAPGAAVAGTVGAAPAGRRLMPGYAGPGKPKFQAEAEAALAAEQAASQDSAPVADSAAAADAPPTKDTPAAADKESPSNGSQAANSDPKSAPPSSTASSPDAGSVAASDPAPTDSNEQSAASQAIQNMQRMFEQRRQIQSQQNQAAQQPHQQQPAAD